MVGIVASSARESDTARRRATMSTPAINGSAATNRVKSADAPAADLKALTRPQLSPADQAVRQGVVVDQGPKAFTESAGAPMQLSGMTPSEFWVLKLGECYGKGISTADCTPWS
jgi:hypothetical protein